MHGVILALALNGLFLELNDFVEAKPRVGEVRSELLGLTFVRNAPLRASEVLVPNLAFNSNSGMVPAASLRFAWRVN